MASRSSSGSRRACVEQVRPDGVVEQVRVLAYDAYRFRSDANVASRHRHRSDGPHRSHVVKARDEMLIVVLPAPDGRQEHQLARLGPEAHVVEDLTGWVWSRTATDSRDASDTPRPSGS